MNIPILTKNLLILASAGSGKTHQLGNRVIGIVAGGVPPERIVALTFTRKAAGEFADSVLTKLAAAATDGEVAGKLRADIGLAEADFPETLERVVKALPRLTLGTMDSFFSRVVRGFQYELGLTGGRFDLLEGPRADAARDEIIADILGDALESEEGEAFFHAFRRANYGREGLQIQEPLRNFLKIWQGLFRSSGSLEWGPAGLAVVAVDEWNQQKDALVKRVERGLGTITFTDKRQLQAVERALEVFRRHTTGSGLLGAGEPAMVTKLLDAVAGDSLTQLSHYKPFALGGACGQAVEEMVRLAASCEMTAAVLRTRAIREVVAAYDQLCDERLRRNGLLGFDDVKELMGEWVGGEDARLRREAVDFRLDARYDHWLLDEFQDTSRADWQGLLPLVDEAVAAGEGSLFIVGDRKQAIYGWRGGDVKLFDEVLARYAGGLVTAPMADSWRSCPEVLALVNRVCGDAGTLAGLFGAEAAARWEWLDHVSAPQLALPEKCGEARVERLDGDCEERLVSLLRELGVGERKMTCGVLMRSNSQVRKIADHLRAEGFDVVEEGRRRPAKDGPVGIVLAQLLRWLAEPADQYARGVVEMSPLGRQLLDQHEQSWPKAWDALLRRASEVGFAAMLSEWVERCRGQWSAFGKQRAADIIAALGVMDAAGAVTAREAADWIERLEVSQSPGAAAVQVMTVHKSKGLGFDVVVIPEVPTDSVPQTQYFEVAQGADWLTSVPPAWARALVPELVAAEADWEVQQRYEGFCMLYVALTRAKRGLYVLLEKLPKQPDFSRPTLSNWVSEALGADDRVGVVFQEGSAKWFENVPLMAPAEAAGVARSLPSAQARRERTTPAGAKKNTAIRRSSTGMRFGRAVHEAFERIGWIDEEPPDTGGFPQIGELLKTTGVSEYFERRGRKVELFREQPVEAILDGRWLSGVIDRLHLHRDPEGRVSRVEVLDFKTDAVERSEELLERYSGQMEAYRKAMELAFPGAEVLCLLVAVGTAKVIEVC
jgi:ATP-dependent helicase/nuclease subunit A